MQKHPERESHLRSILKGLSWRFIATGTTMIVAYLFTGEVETAAKIGGLEFFAKLGLYYGHERAWQLVPRGTIRKAVHGSDEPPASE